MNGRRRGAGKESRHVRLYHYMLNSPAWQSLDAVSRAIYIEIEARYAGNNNGRIYYSTRQAAEALGIGRATAMRALARLEEHGFIVCEKRGAFSLKVRHATEWRLTAHDHEAGRVATKDFMRWSPEIQNTVSPQIPAGLVVKPIGTCSETVVAKRSRNGTCSETVKAQIPDPRFHHKATYSLPGSTASQSHDTDLTIPTFLRRTA